MTPADNEQANAALLFELDEKIEERIRVTLCRTLGITPSPNMAVDLTYMVGRMLLDNHAFMNAMAEEIAKRVYSKFNSSMPTYISRNNTF